MTGGEKMQRTVRRVGSVVVPLVSLFKVTGGQVVRNDAGNVERVSWLGLDWYDRERMRARRARRAAERAERTKKP